MLPVNSGSKWQYPPALLEVTPWMHYIRTCIDQPTPAVDRLRRYVWFVVSLSHIYPDGVLSTRTHAHTPASASASASCLLRLLFCRFFFVAGESRKPHTSGGGVRGEEGRPMSSRHNFWKKESRACSCGRDSTLLVAQVRNNTGSSFLSSSLLPTKRESTYTSGA